MIEREGNKMEKQLLENFEYIQLKINDIKKQEKIDIKQISDLQRYVEMQKNILESLLMLRTAL